MSEVKFDEIVVLPVAGYEGQAKIEFASGVFQNGNVDEEYMFSSGHMPKRYQHLIAAAPDLYEALEWAIDELSRPAQPDVEALDEFKAAMNALKKARGEL